MWKLNLGGEGRWGNNGLNNDSVISDARCCKWLGSMIR